LTQRRRESKSGDAQLDRLPDAELEVMACLWQQGQATARNVREMMDAYRPMTHGSMVTLLKRLEAKGLVSRAKGKVGKAFVYQPTRKPGPTYRRILRDLVHRIFRGNNVEVVSTLLDSNPPTPEELERLQKLVDDLRAEADKRDAES